MTASAQPAQSLAVGRWVSAHPVGALVLRRVARMFVSLFVLLTLAFAMIHLIPGDPVRGALGLRASPALVKQRRAELYLDHPLPQQYLHYLHGLFTGDLGMSTVYDLPVAQLIRERLPNSAAIAGIAFVVIMVVSVPLGMLAAVLTRDGRGRKTELGFTTVTGVFATVPEFVLGVGLVYLFGIKLEWFPVAEKQGLPSYVLPVAALSIGSIAALARIVRAETLHVLGEDYVRTARGKRLPARILYLRHVLPNMLTATLTLGGLLLSGLVGGTVLVEAVFDWPGIGATVVDSVKAQDFALAQAVMVLLGAVVLVVNLVVDLLLITLNPQSTLGRQ